MQTWSRWLSTPRGLPILLTTVVVLPAATLVFLGVRLLQQDVALAGQRRAEMLQDASDRVIRALDTDLASLRASLADPSWPSSAPLPGSIHLLMTRDDIRVDPPEAVAYTPAVAKAHEAPTEPYRALEAAEFRAGDLPKALEMSATLVRSSDPSVQAGALVRQARILRKMGRSSEALPLYEKLARFTTISINGLPADLQARKTRSALLGELSRADELQQEAAALDADLTAGRWRLDRESYEHVSGLLDGWLGSERRPRVEREALAAAVDWLYRQWSAEHDGAFTPHGTRFFGESTPVTIVWASTGERVAAVVGGPTYLQNEWLVKAQRAASPAQVSLAPAADPPASRAFSDSDTLTSHRSAAETGLPWAVAISLAGHTDATEFESRRRTLLAALAAVLVLVAAGSYMIVRSRNREMTLARLQSDFVTAVSHEFRTPLTALRQFGELLDEPGELTQEKRRNYQHAQTRATERLHRLVESLLDFGRMEAGKRPYAFERLDAGLLVRDVVEEFRGELNGSNIALRCSIEPGDCRVDADPEALARAVWNLLDNAAKYSGEGRDVDVAVNLVFRRVSIAVRDRGIGIPPGEQARIFQKFTRGAVATSRHIKGTGIGLAMVQHIVAAHHGTVSVESVEGQGSTFTISLPRI
jgi:signal transduction histidine kinase